MENGDIYWALTTAGWEACTEDIEAEGHGPWWITRVFISFVIFMRRYQKIFGFIQFLDSDSDNATSMTSMARQGSRICCCQSSHFRLFRQWRPLGSSEHQWTSDRKKMEKEHQKERTGSLQQTAGTGRGRGRASQGRGVAADGGCSLCRSAHSC